MSKFRARHCNCSVPGCTNQHKCLFSVPASEEKRKPWLVIIYGKDVPATVSTNLNICAHHFTADCFANIGQYNAGFASKMTLKDGSVPTIRDTTTVESVTPSQTLQRFKHVGCQAQPETAKAATQLSWTTLKAHVRSVATQTKTDSAVDVGVGSSTGPINTTQPNGTRTSTSRPAKRPRLEVTEQEDPGEGSSPTAAPGTQDLTCDPEEPAAESTDKSEASIPIQKIPKYIVFETCLLELFESCPVCQQACDVTTTRRGTFLRVKQQCPHCKFHRQWSSQPLVGSTPAGNLQLSAAVYFSGASYRKLDRIFKSMHLKSYNCGTYRRHAKSFLEPAIVHKWKTEQDAVLQQLSLEQRVVAAGDMRADSAGHSAKYGSYTLMDLKRNTVIDIQLVQSNEVEGSHDLEKEGLKRSLALLEERAVILESIVTDRNPQIRKFLNESNIIQYYDVRHVERGISMQLEKISKRCDPLKEWVPSIKNHLYWIAASSSFPPERVAKWTSLLNHVQDIHTHDDPVFPKCLHPQSATRDAAKWLKAGSPAFDKLKRTITTKKVLENVSQLSPQSSGLLALRLPQRYASLRSQKIVFLIYWNAVQTLPGRHVFQ
ncbi:uncharacterized protein LOC131959829 [Centropristis striata]|uniref:uncharacterized protein LOC131959829 n=1 Tax=Centropristis striata TaxID=184440 RepID=UPI0027E1766A|nr:uncharacterized protein LOC131959829 [Centropristis striata]